jgi:ATP-binding cassette subfamily B protein
VWTLVRTRSRLAEHVRTVREASAATGSFLIETLQAARLVATSNAQVREAARFRTHNDGFVRALMSMQRWSYLSGSAPGLILSAGYAGVFLYGGSRVINETLSLGTLIAFLAYYMKLFQPVQSAMGLYSSIAAVQVSLARVHELLDTPPDVLECAHPRRLPRAAGALEFDGVSIDLGRGRILRDLSFAAVPGQRLALVGPSGCGKSTIADLLVRLLDPDEGTVRLDGYDVRELSLHDLRSRIVLVDQEPMLLHASVDENVRYARPDAADCEIQDAMLAAGVDEIVARLPDGSQTIVGERGAALSVGERQRIAIARALLLNPDVLVLDEPTAALDTVTEQRVLAGYGRVMRGRTTILITHDLALASSADHVIVLGDRSIVERGTPAELQASPGAFAALLAL